MADVSGTGAGGTPITPLANGTQTPPPVPPTADPNTIATTTVIAATAIENAQPPSDAEKPATLTGRAVTRENEGRISKFFRRIFSQITQKETNDAKAINQLRINVNAELSKFDNQVRDLARTEKRDIPRPDGASPAIYSHHFNQMKGHLAEARKQLAELEKLEQRAGELAEEHVKFNDLPGNIQKLKDKVSFLSEQEKIFDDMQALEGAMANYSLDKSWDNFAEVQNKKAALAAKLKTLQDGFNNSPFLKANTKAQAYFSKANWSDTDVYQLIKISFPALKNQAERLEKYTIEITNERVANLENQANRLKSSDRQYKDLSKRIANVDWWIKQIQTNSLLGKIYKFFHRNSLASLQTEAQQLHGWQKETSDTLLEKQKFNSKEIEWLKNVTLIKPNKKDQLIKHIDRAFLESRFTQKKQNLSNQMNEVLNDLNFYLTAQRNPKNVNLDGQKRDIAAGLRELAQNAAGKQIGIEELKKHLNFLYPHLQERIDLIFMLIRDANLQEELNAALLGQAPPAEPVIANGNGIPNAPPMNAPPEAPPMNAPPEAPPMDGSIPNASQEAPILNAPEPPALGDPFGLPSGNTGPTAAPKPRKPQTPVRPSIADQLQAGIAARAARLAQTPAAPPPERERAEDPTLAKLREGLARRAVPPPTEEVSNPETENDDWD